LTNEEHAVDSYVDPAVQLAHVLHTRLVEMVHAVVWYVLPEHASVQDVHTRFTIPAHAVDSYVDPAVQLAHVEHTRLVLAVHAVVSYVEPVVHVAQLTHEAGM
jgi:hypothetical protein